MLSEMGNFLSILENLVHKNDVMQIQENGVLLEIPHLRDNPQSNSHLDAKGKPHDLTFFSDNLFNLNLKYLCKHVFLCF